MIKLYTEEELLTAPYQGFLKLRCEYCGEPFLSTKARILNAINGQAARRCKCRFCSHKCDAKSREKWITINCAQCNKQVRKRPRDIRFSQNFFCSLSCGATYNNTHKTWGNQRSKLERYMEERLTEIYPNLEIHYNRHDAILSELDIYIPSLKLAIELNGIFHYEPIYGEETLRKIQNNDNRKCQACLERGIEFCTIDSSQLKYFKKDNCKPYLKIITDLINLKLGEVNSPQS